MRQPITTLAVLLASGLFPTLSYAVPYGDTPTNKLTERNPTPQINTIANPIIESSPAQKRDPAPVPAPNSPEEQLAKAEMALKIQEGLKKILDAAAAELKGAAKKREASPSPQPQGSSSSFSSSAPSLLALIQAAGLGLASINTLSEAEAMLAAAIAAMNGDLAAAIAIMNANKVVNTIAIKPPPNPN